MAPLVANYIYETRRTAAVQKRERIQENYWDHMDFTTNQ